MWGGRGFAIMITERILGRPLTKKEKLDFKEGAYMFNTIKGLKYLGNLYNKNNK